MKPKDNILFITKQKLAEYLRAFGILEEGQEITYITEDTSRKSYIMKVEYKSK